MVKEKRKRKSKEGTCAYCGKYTEMTTDHVIPRCLFERPLPDMLTVKACGKCNEEKGKHDVYLRDALTSCMPGSESRIAQRIFQDKVRRSHRNRKSQFAQSAMKNAQKISLTTKSGLWVGEGFSIEVDPDRIEKVISFIVRGLYFHLRKVILPADCDFNVQLVDGDNAMARLDFFMKNSSGRFLIGEGVFLCLFCYGEENDSVSLWCLIFYDKVVFTVATTPANYDSATNGLADPS